MKKIQIVLFYLCIGALIGLDITEILLKVSLSTIKQNKLNWDPWILVSMTINIHEFKLIHSSKWFQK